MLKVTKIKKGKFRLPWQGSYKVQKIFDNNIVELSTMGNDDVERVNINKLKEYHHNFPPTNIMVTIVTIEMYLEEKSKTKKRKETNPRNPPCYVSKPENLAWIDCKPRNQLFED
jgi:hypothetical protein